MTHNTPEHAVDSPDSMPEIIGQIIETMGGTATVEAAPSGITPAKRRHIPFGGKVSHADLERAHPFRVAEAVDPGAITRFYDNIGAQPHSTWPAWRVLELGPRGPKHRWELSQATEYLAAMMRRYDLGEGPLTGEPTLELEAWYKAAVTLSAIPSIVDRVLRGSVTPRTAKMVYHSLVTRVLSRQLRPGDRAEALVFALGARTAANEEDPTQFLHLSSPREGENQYRNLHERVFNHDLFRWDADAGIKKPVEIKAHNLGSTRRNHYDPAIVFVPTANILAKSILGEVVDFKKGSEGTALASHVLEKATILAVKEVEEGITIPALDAAGRALARHIDAHRVAISPSYRQART